MRRNYLFPICLALLVSGCAADPFDRAPVNPNAARDVEAVHLDPAAATALLNAYRASKGLRSVRLDPALTAMARRQADAMAAGNEMSHNVAGSFALRLAASGLDAPEAGENLGGGYYSLEDAMSGWRRSREHDANLLIENATRFGIAIAKDPRTHYGIYWAMEMAAEPRGQSWGAGQLMSTTGEAAEIGQ